MFAKSTAVLLAEQSAQCEPGCPGSNAVRARERIERSGHPGHIQLFLRRSIFQLKAALKQGVILDGGQGASTVQAVVGVIAKGVDFFGFEGSRGSNCSLHSKIG